MCGVSPSVLRSWIRRGLLDEPPWTLEQLHVAHDAQDPGPRSQAPHGTTARWNDGCSCTTCRMAHRENARVRKRTKAQARLPMEVRQKLLDRIHAGRPFRTVVREFGLTPNQVWGLTNTDEEWSTALEAAWMASRRDDLEHGTDAAHGCVCRQ